VPVDKENHSSELTTTLHLGRDNQKEADSSAQTSAHLEKILSVARDEDAEVLRKIINGDGAVAMIYIHRGPSQGSRFLITATGVSIGRAVTNEIFLDDVTVSRKHAEISVEEKAFHFSDLGSLNGSYINGVQSKKHLLQSGDEIQVGKFHMLFIGAQQLTGEK
jgi:pSer/pThr/pTyr-binding forkhead associated (FHA) protein